jgi:signal transduction histidine kinase
MEDAERFPRVVSLACHDLRSPLATVYGFARTLTRSDEHDERTARYLGMIEAAAEQMTELLDELGVAARIMANRFEAVPRELDTLELVQCGDGRIVADGTGATVETDLDAASGALRGLAIAALRHGPVDEVRWTVDGRVLVLAPVTAAAAPVVMGEEVRDLGALVGRMVLDALGATVALDGESLRVVL